jgi:UDP-2,3-diacylglucosamine hydrolase
VSALFISDLHLDAARPDITAQFLEFLRTEATGTQALYILGDLFEAWIGDDDPEPQVRQVVQALERLTAHGVPCRIMHGNRDFLLGQQFCKQTGVELLPDGTVIELHGRRVLLMHGDTLCTDDHSYQRLRRIVRNPLVQGVLRRLSLRQRRSLAQKMRAGSKAHIDTAERAQPYIMDVNPDAVVRALREHRAEILVHGHTHRPAVHQLSVDGTVRTRIVLGDWYEQGSVLRWDAAGFELVSLQRA